MEELAVDAGQSKTEEIESCNHSSSIAYKIVVFIYRATAEKSKFNGASLASDSANLSTVAKNIHPVDPESLK